MTQPWKDIKQKILPRTLFGRSLLIIVLPILLMQMIVTYIFISRHWDNMSDKLVYALAGEITSITERLKTAKTEEEREQVIRLAADNLSLTVSIEDEDKTQPPEEAPSFNGLAWNSVEEKLQRALARSLNGPFTINAYLEDRWFEVLVPIGKGKVVRHFVHERRLTSSTTYIFLLWLLGSSIILMAIAIIFMRNQVRPIRRLAIAAEKLGKGQDVADLKIEGAREVRQAARAFLDMRGRIRRQIEQRTAMLAGVSHDLRTPLTRMKLQLAMGKDLPGVENLRQDLEEMERMLEGYLAFARGNGNEQTERVDLKSVLDRICGNARRQGYAVEEDCADDITLRVRPMALERALGNIVLNACKYGKQVWVSASVAEKEIEVCVDDDGPGIPAEQHEEVFRPFYRIEKSRNNKTGGVGLGLSIAQDIVHGHGGDIRLEKSPRGGLRVVVRLPV